MNIQGNSKRLARCGLGVLLMLALCGQIAQAQVQRKPKPPKPPSYDDVMQRALSEKKSASNAPVAVKLALPAEPKIQSLTNFVATPTPSVTVDELLKEAKATQAQNVKPVTVTSEPKAAVVATPQVELKPQPPTVQPTVTAPVVANPVATAPVAPAPVVRTEAAPTATAPAQPVAFPEATKSVKQPAKSKGPVFSPLPPDLAPANEVPRAQSTPVRTGAVVPVESTNDVGALDDKHLLAIGDRLSFRIVEDEEEAKPLTVADSGQMEVPYIGRVDAVGKSCQDLARIIKMELEKKYYKQATVILAVDLMARTRGKIYIVGPVRMPGPQDVPSDEELTLSKAIMRAGGFTDFADKKNVKVTRKSTAAGGDQTFTVNVTEIIEKGRTEFDLPLLPGDLVYIEERLIRF